MATIFHQWHWASPLQFIAVEYQASKPIVLILTYFKILVTVKLLINLNNFYSGNWPTYRIPGEHCWVKHINTASSNPSRVVVVILFLFNTFSSDGWDLNKNSWIWYPFFLMSLLWHVNIINPCPNYRGRGNSGRRILRFYCILQC